MDPEATYECEDCGHAYTSRYGRWREVAGGERWLCWSCADERRA